MELNVVTENIARAVKNRGLAERAFIVISLRSLSDFKFPPAISPNHFFATYICYPGILAFLRATRAIVCLMNRLAME